MRIIIYVALITMSIVFGIVINTSFAKEALLILGSVFEVAAIWLCIVALLGHFHAPKISIPNKVS